VGWKRVVTLKDFREELISLGQRPGTNIRELCRRFQISAKTYYKWKKRFEAAGRAGLENVTRRPQRSPRQSAPVIEEAVVELREKCQGWGARKIESVFEQETGMKAPARSTIHDILRRNGCIDLEETLKHRKWKRFEREGPNQLWQMDFKGWPEKERGYRCEPLSIIDDHSRYAVCLEACPDQRTETVKERLTRVFRRYGMPHQMMMDNGSPWGYDAIHRDTPLTTWLMCLGIGIVHCRPYHPQTQGKVERFHRTLQLELLRGRNFPDRRAVQMAFDRWREFYNQRRPHQALAMKVPATRYHLSPREFPDKPLTPEYNTTDLVRRVDVRGHISYRGQRYLISKGFRGYPVALRHSGQDGIFDVYFFTQKVARIDIKPQTS